MAAPILSPEVRARTNKNLSHFKSGAEWRGNSAGRPKRLPITDEYRDRLEQLCPDEIRTAYNSKFKCTNERCVKGKTGTVKLRKCKECDGTGFLQLLPKGKTTWGMVASLRMCIDATQGVIQATREMREAIEGYSRSRVEISSAEDRELRIKVVYDEDAPRTINVTPEKGDGDPHGETTSETTAIEVQAKDFDAEKT